MSLTQRKKEDMRLVFKTLRTLANKTEFCIADGEQEMMKSEEEIEQVASAVLAIWAFDDLQNAIHEKPKDRHRI